MWARIVRLFHGKDKRYDSQKYRKKTGNEIEWIWVDKKQTKRIKVIKYSNNKAALTQKADTLYESTCEYANE